MRRMGFRGPKPDTGVLERRQLQLSRGRTQLFWAIERTRSEVRTRSWGPRRKEITAVHAFRSADRAARDFAARIEAQRARGFRDDGDSEPPPWDGPSPTEGPRAVAAVSAAIREVCVPRLRAAGFRGALPKLHRVGPDRHDVVWFTWGRAGGDANVGLAVLAPRPGATATQDYARAIGVRNRVRTDLASLLGAAERRFCFFDEASAAWGADWPRQLAQLIAGALAEQGEAWLARQRRRG